MQIFFEQSDRSFHEYPDQYLYLRLPWKDYRLCTKQFLPQNYHRTFPLGLLMSMAHYICVTGTGRYQSFLEGYRLIRSTIQQEKYQYLFQCAKSSIDFEAFMKLAG